MNKKEKLSHPQINDADVKPLKKVFIMTSTNNGSASRQLMLQLAAIAFLMLTGMTIYETLKQIIFPNILLWESHIITIIFSTLCATVASFFALRKLVELNSALSAKNIESEHLRQELEKTVEDLKVTLSEVKTLAGLLPICASCKKIRDDKGYWNQIESYISKHSDVNFSHGICPECVEKLYSELSLGEKDT